MLYANDLSIMIGGQSIKPSTLSTVGANNGSGVDLIKGDGRCTATVNFGVTGGTGTITATPKIQESDDNSTFTDVVMDAGQAFATASATTGNQPSSNYRQVVTFQRTKRYCRVVVTITGTSGTILCSADVTQQPKTF